MRQDVHTEDAVEAAQVSGARQVHLRKRNQVAQARFGQEVLPDLREIGLDPALRNARKRRLRIEAAPRELEGGLANVRGEYVNTPSDSAAVHRIAQRDSDGVCLLSGRATRTPDTKTLPAVGSLLLAKARQHFI